VFGDELIHSEKGISIANAIGFLPYIPSNMREAIKIMREIRASCVNFVHSDISDDMEPISEWTGGGIVILLA
jgi:hypothetical protein